MSIHPLSLPQTPPKDGGNSARNPKMSSRKRRFNFIEQLIQNTPSSSSKSDEPDEPSPKKAKRIPSSKRARPLFSNDSYGLLPQMPCSKRQKVAVSSSSSKKKGSDSFVSATKNACSKGQLIRSERAFDLEEIGRGDYKVVFRIKDGQPQLIPGVDNSTLTVKVYNKRHVSKPRATLIQYTDTQLEQYRKLQKVIGGYEGIGVARIFNCETVSEDGFFLVEYIKKPLPEIRSQWRAPLSIQWIPSTKDPKTFEELKERPRRILQQLRAFIDLALKHDLALDLSLSNFLIDDQDNLVLIDLIEQLESSEQPVFYQISSEITNWSCHNPHIRKYLLENAQTNCSEFYKYCHDTIRSLSSLIPKSSLIRV